VSDLNENEITFHSFVGWSNFFHIIFSALAFFRTYFSTGGLYSE
jgi:hypothetical protein